tara:strand:+ start:2135 stop:2785 length:651 start_codon:yes stop_codon:yes gene_type:complete
MRKLDLDLEYNEFDNFISKKGMSGLLKGIGAQIGACSSEVSSQNPEFAPNKIKGLSKSENARYQALMTSCMKSKKKKDPRPKPKGGGVRHIRPTDYKGMAKAGLSAKSINKFKRAEQKRIDNAQVSTTMAPPPSMKTQDPSAATLAETAQNEYNNRTDVLPTSFDTPDVLPTSTTPIPTPDPVGEILDKKDKKGNMKTYLMLAGVLVVGFVIYKNV